VSIVPRDLNLIIANSGFRCSFTAVRGGQIGWKAKYAPEHILEDADREVETILANL